jgi:hypothetical protein
MAPKKSVVEAFLPIDIIRAAKYPPLLDRRGCGRESGHGSPKVRGEEVN